MPKRTNEFQRLIHAIEMQLNDQSLVSESRFLPDWATGDEREADIVIETGTGPYSMKIVECRDQSRRQDIRWIDEMIGKYGQSTDGLVLVSKSGFTPRAERKAEALGIITLTLKKVKKVDWTQVVGKLAQVSIVLTEIKVETFLVSPPLDVSHSTIDSLQFYNSKDELQGSLREVTLGPLQSLQEIEGILKACRQPGNHTILRRYLFPEGSYVLDAANQKHEVVEVHLLMRVHTREGIPVDLQHGSYKEAQVAYGRLQYDREQGLLTVVETFGKPLSADLSLRPILPARKKNVGKNQE